MKVVLNFLESKQYPLPEGLGLHLYSIMKHHSLKKNFRLVRPGMVSDRIYFVAGGFIRCYVKKEDKKICKWFMGPGDVVISICSFFRQEESRETVETMTSCELYSISYRELEEAYDRWPDFRKIGQRLTEKYYCDADKRADDLRMMTPKELYDDLARLRPDLIEAVDDKNRKVLSIENLASYMGITPPTFRAAKEAFEKEGKNFPSFLKK